MSELRQTGWRAAKGPAEGNKSGFSATGHRLLLVGKQMETKTESGIVLMQKTAEAERSLSVYATVVEIGHDAWSDKSTDYCAVGDEVLVGQYTGKFEVSPNDDIEYRFINDLDIISVVTRVSKD
jgi:co-chaperonin GroES (HSP10)